MSKNMMDLTIVTLLCLIINVQTDSKPSFGLIRDITSQNSNHMSTAKFSPDGQFLASISPNDGLTIYNTNDFSKLLSDNIDFTGDKNSYGLAFTPDQTKIIYHTYSDKSSSTIVRHFPSLTLENQLQTTIKEIQNVDVSHDGTRYIRCGSGGFQIVDLNINRIIFQNPHENYGSNACKFSPQGDYAVTGLSGAKLYIYDKNNVLLFEYTSASGVTALDWNSNGHMLAYAEAYQGKGIYIWNKSTKQAQKYHGFIGEQYVLALDWSPDDNSIAFSQRNQKTMVIDLTSSQNNIIFQIPLFGYCWQVHFSPNSQYLLQARAQDRKINIYGYSCAVDSYYQGFQCKNCPSTCKKCSSASSCVQCKQGYSLKSGFCVNPAQTASKHESKCPENCLSCNSDTECTVCQDGFHGPTCSKNCPPKCTSCSSDMICLTCQHGYAGTDCNICSFGYIQLSQNPVTCGQCPNVCNACKSPTICTQCHYGYQNVRGSVTNCRKCITSFYSVSNPILCLPCPKRCKDCKNGVSCITCEPGYSNTTACTSCTVGYYKSNDNPFTCSVCPAKKASSKDVIPLACTITP